MSRYTLADRLIGYRSATPLAYDLFGAKPAADQLHRMPPGPRPRAVDERGVCTRCRLPGILMLSNPCTLGVVHTLRPGRWE